MTVLGRGLGFQPVLVTQTCTYKSKNITLTLQIFQPPPPPTPPPPKKKGKQKTNKQTNLFYQKEHNNSPSPPPKKPNPKTHNNNRRSHNTSECFDMSLKLSKLLVKNDKGQNQMTNIIESSLLLTKPNSVSKQL